VLLSTHAIADSFWLFVYKQIDKPETWIRLADLLSQRATEAHLKGLKRRDKQVKGCVGKPIVNELRADLEPGKLKPRLCT